MYKRHMVENVLRIRHQLSLIASQEQMLEVEATALLAKIDRKAAASGGGDKAAAKRRAKVVRTVKKRKEELGAMRDNLKASETEVKLMLNQRNVNMADTGIQLMTDVSSDDAR